MAKILSDCRDEGALMLLRWGQEVTRGEGKPNILAMVDHIPETNGEGMPGCVGAMFSPRAEKADKILHEFRHIDTAMTQYLISFALGLTITDMARREGVNRHVARAELEGSLCAFGMAVYYKHLTTKRVT